MKKYKSNSSSNDKVLTLSFTPEHGLLYKNTHQQHFVLLYVYVGGKGKSKGWWTERPKTATQTNSSYS